MNLLSLLILLLGNVVLPREQIQKTYCNPCACKEVKIKDWGRRIIMIGDDVLERAKESIIEQIGEEEYNVVMKNYNVYSWPKQMNYDMARALRDSVFMKQVYEKLDSLKMCKIATFKNMHEGRFRANLVILRVSYLENKEWDKNAKWENTYFVFRQEHIVEH